MNIWTIYDHPLDFPDSYVARRFELDQPTDDVITAPTLEVIRDLVQNRSNHELVCLPRHPDDDLKIIECWL